MASERKNINVSKNTYKKLEDRKGNGQSFDGVITELLEEVEN